MVAILPRKDTELGLRSFWQGPSEEGPSSLSNAVGLGADDVDGTVAADGGLPAVAIGGVVPEDVDPGVGEEAAVFADVDAARWVAADDEARADCEVPAAGGGAFVDLAAVVHSAAEALVCAVV